MRWRNLRRKVLPWDFFTNSFEGSTDSQTREVVELFLLYTTRIYNDINNNGTTNTFLNTVKYRRIQVRTVLLTSGFGSSTRGERHNSYYADHTIWPHQRAAHLVMFKIFVSRDPKNPITSSTLNCMTETQLPACMVQSQLLNSVAENSILCLHSRNSRICLHGPISTPNWLFFKILKFSAHLFRAWSHLHSRPISCLGVYYDNGDCHILYARA